MSGQPQRRRPIVLVVAMVLMVPMFGAGLWVGKSSVEPAQMQRVPAQDALDESATDDSAHKELAACQRKLARQKKTMAASSAVAVRPEASADAAVPMTRIEVLQQEIKSCRHNELLHGAEICRSVRLHLDALLSLPKNDVLCIQRVRVADYIDEDFDKCAAFTSPPTESQLLGYTDEERKTILDAVEVARTLDEDKLTDLLNGVHRGCYGEWGKISP